MARLADVDVVGVARNLGLLEAGNMRAKPCNQARLFACRGGSGTCQIGVVASVDIENVDGVDRNAAAVLVPEIEIGDHNVRFAWPIRAHELTVAPGPAFGYSAEAVAQHAIRIFEPLPIDPGQGKHERYGLHEFVAARVLTPKVEVRARECRDVSVVGCV